LLRVGLRLTVTFYFDVLCSPSGAYFRIFAIVSVQPRGADFMVECRLAERTIWPNVPVGRTYLLAERTRWVNLIKALAFLPPDLVLETWNHWLVNPPNGLDQVALIHFQEFVDYV
uniref:Uncharacterized protein n=1 Tax=Romanomermis culicivorax TaxID=13658 RepID=A0A915J5P0_ROMCU